VKIRHPQEGKAESKGRPDAPFPGRRGPQGTVAGPDRGTRAFDQAVQEIEIRALLEEMEALGKQLFRFPSADLLARYRSAVGALLRYVEQGLRVRKDLRWRRHDRSAYVLIERAERALGEIESVLVREGERTRLLDLLDEVKGCLISLLL